MHLLSFITNNYDGVITHLEPDTLECEVKIALISYSSKVILEILQARFQQYMNQELPDVHAGFREGRGTRDQITNIHCIIKKARQLQKNYCIH